MVNNASIIHERIARKEGEPKHLKTVKLNYLIINLKVT